MKKIILSFSLLTSLILASCSYDRSPEGGNYDPNDPGFEYAPEGDMYYPVAYEPLLQNPEDMNPYNWDSMSMRTPVQGTVARGKLDYFYPYKNDAAGYEASAGFKNPIAKSDASFAEGKRVYEIYCWQCHGKEDSPKGSLVSTGKFPNPTWAFDKLDLVKTLPEGRMFHSITFGRNLMGPHGFIVTPQQRWMIINYLKHFANTGATAPAGNDTTQAAGNTPAAATTTQNANGK
ncbi:MAG: cytochrome c [Bacteroidota bacterium]|nr:cytochrome c [Bacteroidota bacterium]